MSLFPIFDECIETNYQAHETLISSRNLIQRRTFDVMHRFSSYRHWSLIRERTPLLIGGKAKAV